MTAVAVVKTCPDCGQDSVYTTCKVDWNHCAQKWRVDTDWLGQDDFFCADCDWKGWSDDLVDVPLSEWEQVDCA